MKALNTLLQGQSLHHFFPPPHLPDYSSLALSPTKNGMPLVRLEERVPGAFNFFINHGNINKGHMNGNQNINNANIPVTGIPDFVVRAHNKADGNPVSYAAKAAGREVLAALGVEIDPLPQPQLQPERRIKEGEGDAHDGLDSLRRRLRELEEEEKKERAHNDMDELRERESERDRQIRSEMNKAAERAKRRGRRRENHEHPRPRRGSLSPPRGRTGFREERCPRRCGDCDCDGYSDYAETTPDFVYEIDECAHARPCHRHHHCRYPEPCCPHPHPIFQCPKPPTDPLRLEKGERYIRLRDGKLAWVRPKPQKKKNGDKKMKKRARHGGVKFAGVRDGECGDWRLYAEAGPRRGRVRVM